MKTLLFLMMSFLALNVLNAQQLEVIGTSGGFYKTNSGSLTFSMGEVITETITQGDCCFTQGFCQANITITAVPDVNELDYELIAYPNPVKSYVILKTSRQSLTGLKYILLDLNGRLIDQKLIDSHETQIPFHFLIPSTYILKVLDKKHELKVYKIIKSK